MTELPALVRRLAFLSTAIGLILLALPGPLAPASAAAQRDATVYAHSQNRSAPAQWATVINTPVLAPRATATSPARALTINGGAFQSPTFGSVFAITGSAPVGNTVNLHFHKAGTPATDYSILRTVVADDTGFWIRPIAAIVGYRYYATDDTLTSPSVLNAP